MTVFLDNGETLGIGAAVDVSIWYNDAIVTIKGLITWINVSRNNTARTHLIEILDFGKEKPEYLQVLYDRASTLPESLQRDFGASVHFWQNIVHRVARMRK